MQEPWPGLSVPLVRACSELSAVEAARNFRVETGATELSLAYALQEWCSEVGKSQLYTVIRDLTWGPSEVLQVCVSVRNCLQVCVSGTESGTGPIPRWKNLKGPCSCHWQSTVQLHCTQPFRGINTPVPHGATAGCNHCLVYI